MISIFAGIVMLGILIFIHELGHFCIAKLAGVKVLKFSLGFGPRLVSKQWGETEYMICAIPLGGYVQMLGENPEKENDAEPLTPEELKRSFAHKPVGQRMGIVLAGPVMNLIFPFLLLPLTYLIGVDLPAYLDEPPCIGYVLPESQAATAGFLAKDCILSVNGQEVSSWDGTNRAIITAAGEPLRFALQRHSDIAEVTFLPRDGGLEGLQSFGLLPLQEARIGALMAGLPAEQAGLQLGDLILSINGQTVDSWYDLKFIIQKLEQKPAAYIIERDGRETEVTITAAEEKNGDQSRFLIGISPQQETTFKRFGLTESIREGTNRTYELIELTFVFIKKLLFGEVSAKNIGGPITVIQLAGHAAQTDLASILSILAFLSIQLGILNLLPIPVLDGGHIFFGFFELVFRRPLSLKTREMAQQVGLVLILLLMGLAFYNDIVRIFFGGRGG